VIALLMDGPQVAGRWPGRYATVVADDPGSSVLTLTSAGMSWLNKADGYDRSRVIALWKDAHSGRIHEIALPDDACATVLTLWASTTEEFTADGRSDGGAAGLIRWGRTDPISHPS